MTIQFYIHSIAKRAEAIALLDSGATKNFINLSYAKWLRLPIKQLPTPRTLLNVDGTKNKSGKLQFYTDLDVQTISKIQQNLPHLPPLATIFAYFLLITKWTKEL